MKNKKFISFLVILLVFINSLFSYGGALSGQKKLRVYSTEFFQIIFPEDCAATAELLSQNADRIYYEIAESYGMVPQVKMPVVITPGVEIFNAYWVHAPYNHIVMYDTCGIQELAVNSEQMLQTFRHELIHAFTYNMKNGFWLKIGTIFGECINWGSVAVTRGMAEGATMTGESAAGEGRMNDNYSWQMVKQAKIEGKFPSFSDVQGASDSYPAGAFYYFNGAFHQYLQEKYGMEAYGQWWYRLVNMKSFSLGSSFKKAFGISVNKAWKDFYEWIPVPEVNADPVENHIAKDLFNPSAFEFSKRNKNGSRYENLTRYKDGLFYTDDACSTAYVMKNNKAEPEKLFYFRYLQQAKINYSGEYVCLNYNDYDQSAVKAKTAVYSLKKKSFFTLSKTGLHNGIILKKGDELYLAALGYENLNYFIYVYRLNEKDGKILSEEMVEKFNIGKNNYVQSIEDISDENTLKIAYIKVKGVDYRLCTHEIGSEEQKEYYPLDRKVDFRDLSLSENGSLSFSWIEKNHLPAAGSFNLETETFSFDERNICGGVYNPVSYYKGYAYIAKYYKSNKLMYLDMSDQGLVEAEETNSLVNSVAETDSQHYQEILASSDFMKQSKKYNPFNFMRGIFIPASICTSKNYSTNSVYSPFGIAINQYLLPFGVTYGSSDPWNSGIWLVSAGYGFETNSAALQFYYQNGTDTSLFSWTINGSSEFDSKGWKQAYGEVTASSFIPFGRIFTVSLSGSSSVNYGRENLMYNAKENSQFTTASFLQFGCAESSDDKNYLYNVNSAAIALSTVRKNGPGNYEKTGFTVSALVVNQNTDLVKGSSAYFDSVFSITGYIPKLLKGKEKENLTLNMPVKLNIQLFPVNTNVKSGSEEYYYNLLSKMVKILGSPVLQWSCESVLLGWNCQKAVPGISALFFDDLRLSFIYRAAIVSKAETQNWRIADMQKYFTDDNKLASFYGFRLALGLNPNFGVTAYSQLKVTAFIDLGLGSALGYVSPSLYSFGIKATF